MANEKRIPAETNEWDLEKEKKQLKKAGEGATAAVGSFATLRARRS